MRSLSCTIMLLFIVVWAGAQSPHGNEFKKECSLCHTSKSWVVNKADVQFNHDSSRFSLIGQHPFVNCRNCHTSLVFTDAKTSCVSCHTDVHNNTVGQDCNRCHTPNTWLISNVTEIHQQGRLPLSGSHKNVECSSCHVSASKLQFEPLGVECVDCHRNDFQQTTNPNHVEGGYSSNCLDCHKSSAINWNTTEIDHSFFPLTDGHKVACTDCHATGVLEKIPANCDACHIADFNSSLTPNHVDAGIPNTCEECHTPLAWKPSGFDHITTGFELTGGHLKIQQCSNCHQGNLTSAQTDCFSCHQTQYNGAPNHVSQGFPTNCLQCHTTQNWSASNFDHSKTNFPLTGQHVTVDCASCHTNGFEGTSSDCNSCHAVNYNQAQTPSHSAAGIPTSCEDCHTPAAWKPSSFSHTTTGFELTGGHLKIQQCSDCHKGRLTAANTDCFSCHQTQYNGAPNHVSQGFPTNCLQCHTTQSWSASNFDHSNTNFPLTGQHVTVDCASCHTNGFAGTSSDCNSCHAVNYNQAQTPSHNAAGIPTTCENCHTPVSWKPSGFDHKTTGFELTGGHLKIQQCSDCHKGSLTAANPDCFSCHQTQYNGAPNHVSQGFPTNCIQCHTTQNWLATFDHSKTNFPLVGKHVGVDCASCHTNGFAGTSTECNSCHAANYNQSQTPSHSAAGIPTACEECHTPVGWKQSGFSHTTTGFELTGGHLKIQQCSDCHKGSLTAANPDCFSCHQAQYNGAPDHLTQGFPTNCTLCHSTNNWLETNFDHSKTNFPLVGKHFGVDCASCHTNGFAGTSTECNSCHAANYNQSQTPSHSAAGIPTTCEDCHTPAAWKPSSFNHTTTGFELTGGHRLIAQCADCHKGNLISANQQCISCHQFQYDYAPQHKQFGYPLECTMCHTTNDWIETNFNHSQTGFPLTGKHTAVDCNSCHKNGFAGTSTECSSCHLANYQSAQVPSHTAAGIPTTCDECHNTTAWKPSGFNHATTGFPLTGGHLFVAQCSSCHKGNLISASTDCFSCHQTQYNGAPNHLAQGYPKSCTMCHTTNNWLETNFNHNNTSFPLTGAHKTVDCSLCHTGGFTGTPTDCVSCHLMDYNGTTNPNHKASGFPTDCASCHSTTTWSGATFNHDSQFFPIYSGEHRGEWSSCTTCHTNSSNYAEFTCLVCHEHSKSSMDSEHRGKSGYSYVSSACYSCHPRGKAD